MNTSGRRQKQARNGYKHLSKRQRPHYNVVSYDKARRKLERLLEKQKLMQTRKKSSK